MLFRSGDEGSNPSAGAILSSRRGGRSSTARTLGCGPSDVGSTPIDHTNWTRRVGRVRLIAAVSKTARAVPALLGSNPRPSSKPSHALVDQAVEAGLLNRAVGVQVLAGAPTIQRVRSSKGRAAASHADGWEFESPRIHQPMRLSSNGRTLRSHRSDAGSNPAGLTRSSNAWSRGGAGVS